MDKKINEQLNSKNGNESPKNTSKINNNIKINKDNILSQKCLSVKKDNIINNEKMQKKNYSSEKIKIVNNHNNNDNEDEQNQKNPATLRLQEKLKQIFFEREKAKLKYNKQAIPEQLKYTSDDEESNYSNDVKFNDKTNKNEKNENINLNSINVNNTISNNNTYKEKILEEKNKLETNNISLNKLKMLLREKAHIENDTKNDDNNIEKDKKIEKEKIEKEKIEEKLESPKKKHKEINEIKTFTRRRYNNYKNNEDGKEKNLYQLLLSKKMKDINDEEDKNENNQNEKQKEEFEEKKDNIKNELMNNEKDKEEKIKEVKDEKKEKKEKEEKIEINEEKNEEDNNKEENKENEKDNNNNIKQDESNNENKNMVIKQDTNSKSLKENISKYPGVIQLKKYLNIKREKSDFTESETFTEITLPQRNKLILDLTSPRSQKESDFTNVNININNNSIDNNNDNEYYINNRDDENLKSPTFHSSTLNAKSKTISRFDHNSKTIKEDQYEKCNIMKLMQLIKNKKNEREQIDKEKEKAKEEMFKRAKSHASRNWDSLQNFSQIDKTKDKIDDISSNIYSKKVNSANKKNLSGSPKLEVYSKKTMMNKNKKNLKNICKYKTNDNFSKLNMKNIEVLKTHIESPKNDIGEIKKNSVYWTSNKNVDRIVVNHRVKKKINIKNYSNIKNINNTKNENFKDVINRYSTPNMAKLKKINSKNEIDINCKKTYEKPVFLYNKQRLLNFTMEGDNIDTYNNSNNSNNIIKKNILNNKIIMKSSIPKNIYNPRKIKFDKINSMEKINGENNINNRKYYDYTNYNLNYSTYHGISNNLNLNNLNKVYFKKKKSILLEKSNYETNTSSTNISKSKNYERNKKYKYNKNNFKKDNSGISPNYPNYYSLLYQNEKNNSTKKINLKVNKKSFYLNKNQNMNYHNESGENESGNGRSFVFDQNYLNKRSNINDKSCEKYDSFVTKNNTIIKSYKSNININNDQYIRKLGLQKIAKNKGEILIDFDADDNKSVDNCKNNSMNKIINNTGMLSSRKKPMKKKINIFKIEDLLVFEEKMDIIIDCLENRKEIKRQCFDLWNYFFNSSIYKKIEKIFDKEKDINIAKLCINYLLISLIICYEYTIDQDAYLETNSKLLEIMELNYNNLMRLFQQLINTIDIENQNSIWIKRLLNIFDIYSKKGDFFFDNDDILIITPKIIQNNKNINLNIQNLLSYFQTENYTLLLNYFLQIKTKTYEDLNLFFQNNILEIENEEGSLIALLYLRNNSIFSPIPPPYIKTPNRKKYTLVLDLDETLVNFKIKKGREGYVRLRPFLFGFLEEVSQYYELIIFTSATEAYANSVIEAIEHDKKYFDHIFYRQHTIIVGNEFVKDLTRIGRPLNSTIIIDNMPQNFRFQKENGINIKPFWGQDSNDKTLYDLMPILLDIAKNGGDVRISLNKYKDELIGKITSNVSKK